MAVSRHDATPSDQVKLVHHLRGRNPASPIIGAANFERAGSEAQQEVGRMVMCDGPNSPARAVRYRWD